MDVCPFCPPIQEDLRSKNAAHSSSASGQTTLCIAQNDLCFALWDLFPVNKGHALVIPFRHTPDDYNIGFNVLRGIRSGT